MSQTPSDLADGVPFSFFCSLLREISKAPSHKVSTSHRYGSPDYPALKILKLWVNRLQRDYSPLPLGTTAIIFKLLFPDEDHDRKYDMQENRLAHNIAETFCIDQTYLSNWLSENASGCLGEELKIAMERSSTTPGGHISPLSITQVDELLDELASLSRFSHVPIRKKYPVNKRRTRLAVIKDLFRTLSPIDASFLTQIILKDLRPILYPLRDTHYIASLLGHNASSVKMLCKEDAMNVWDPSKWMLKSYRVKSTLTEVTNGFELPPNERGPNLPRIGIPVTIPKSEKGRSPRHVLRYFHSNSSSKQQQQVWAETKYDGERAQIHVEIIGGRAKITIFSKSKRDSTQDRMAIHEVIRRALGLSADGACTGQSRVKTNIILDAEMVAFHGDKVDEFWRIKGLIENTAIGARARSRKNHPVEESQVESEACSQLSMATTVSDPQLRLGLIFFDILFLNSQSLLMTPYRRRREILESLIHLLPGECLLAERFLVGVTSGAGSKVEDSFVESLDRVFSHSIATHQEGLMLKGDETFYHDFSTPWVKLKKDYIPGYGDTIDMAVVGVAWERERGRVLRVPPSTMTTFYIGAVENPEEIRRDPSRRPHLQVYFTVSYGLTRSQLEEINFLIRSSETVPYNSPTGIKRLGYTFTLLSSLPEPPFLLKIPLLAELYGAGFTKSPGSRHYELRFPRTTKIHRPSDRPWTEGINLKELHKVACMSVGRDSSSKEARDMTAAMWGITPSPGVNCSVKRKRRENTYREKLAELDGRTWNPERGQSLGELSPLAKKRRLGETVTASEAQVMVPSQSSRTPSDSVAHVQPLATSQKPNFVALDHTLCQNHGNEARGSLKLAIPMPCSPPSTPQKRRPQMQRSSTAQPSLRVASPCMKGNVAESVGGSNAQFVENALVWFAKPRGKSWKVKNTVPREQRIHSVEALMTGCGWYEGRPAASWVEKGAIFVDNTCKVGQNMASPALEMLKEHMRVLPRNEGRKPIWVFDQKSWTLDNALYLFE